jgi:hypothetical protein
VSVVNDSTMSILCGLTDTGGATNGIVQNPVIFMNTNKQMTPSGIQRTLGHELGHLLGMDHSACNKNDSIMRDDFNCETTESTYVHTSDSLPVEKSVYGGGTKDTCGWY